MTESHELSIQQKVQEIFDHHLLELSIAYKYTKFFKQQDV